MSGLRLSIMQVTSMGQNTCSSTIFMTRVRYLPGPANKRGMWYSYAPRAPGPAKCILGIRTNVKRIPKTIFLMPVAYTQRARQSNKLNTSQGRQPKPLGGKPKRAFCHGPSYQQLPDNQKHIRKLESFSESSWRTSRHFREGYPSSSGRFEICQSQMALPCSR